MKIRVVLVSLIAIIAVSAQYACAYWSPEWQVKFTTEFDTGEALYKDTYYIGASVEAANDYLLKDDIRKVHTPGWPDATYAGTFAPAISMVSIVDTVELGRDARGTITEGTITWDVDLSANYAMNGVQTITWAMTNLPADVTLSLKDYSSDSSRTSSIASVDLGSAADYSFAVSAVDGTYRYLSIEAAVGMVEITAAIIQDGADVKVQWNGTAGTTYAIIYSDRMNGVWNVLPGSESIVGVDGTMTSSVLDVSMGKRFFKVVTVE